MELIRSEGRAACAFYGSAELSSKEMHKGRERDGAAFVFAVLFNDHVYRKP